MTPRNVQRPAGPTRKRTTSVLADNGAQLKLADTPARTCNAPPQVPAGDTPVLRATATVSGKPVVVLVCRFQIGSNKVLAKRRPEYSDCFLTQVMVDPINLGFLKNIGQSAG